MFSLHKESLRLADVNPRKEIHGDEKVLAVDLKFVRALNKASVSILKRELKSSTLIATRMLEQMEVEEIVGPAADNGLRDVIAVPV